MARFFLLPLSLVVVAIASLTVGRYPLTLHELATFLGAQIGVVAMSQERADLIYNILVEIRLPRVLAAALIGAALSTSGAAFQAVFRNPLVSPGILGVLGGASFGAALGILFSGTWLVVQTSAFVFGVAAVMAGVLVANLFGRASIVMLILGGMISGAFFTSLLSILKYAADPNDQLPAIVYWLMGSLGGLDLSQISAVAPPILAGIMLLSFLGRALDALSMGDDEARALGVPVEHVRYSVIAIATLASSLSVALAGMIGWVGLVVPHAARLLLGPVNNRLLPASAFLGATFLILADCLARSVTVAEIPIGIVTELLGVPCFVLVLRHARRAWL